MRIAIAIEATAAELLALLGNLRKRQDVPQIAAWPTPPPMPQVPPMNVDVRHQLTVDDPRRYWYTGRVGNYGEREAIDIRTERRGVFDGGWRPGAYVCDDGRIEYERMCDNPWIGMTWS